MVGLGDSQTTQRLAAVVVINPNKKTNMEDLLKWCNENMQEAEVMLSMMIKIKDYQHGVVKIIDKNELCYHC